MGMGDLIKRAKVALAIYDDPHIKDPNIGNTMAGLVVEFLEEAESEING